jgi:arsenate reductase
LVCLMCSRDDASKALAAGLGAPRTPSPENRVTAPLVLFVCRSNTALSIMADAILRHRGEERFRAAGESITDRVNPLALECPRTYGIAIMGLKSKPWGQFFGLYAPTVRLVIALNAVYAGTANWARDTQVARWNTMDPADVVGSECAIRTAFDEVFGTLELRIRLFLALPLEQLEGRALAQALERIEQPFSRRVMN